MVKYWLYHFFVPGRILRFTRAKSQIFSIIIISLHLSNVNYFFISILYHTKLLKSNFLCIKYTPLTWSAQILRLVKFRMSCKFQGAANFNKLQISCKFRPLSNFQMSYDFSWAAPASNFNQLQLRFRSCQILSRSYNIPPRPAQVKF